MFAMDKMKYVKPQATVYNLETSTLMDQSYDIHEEPGGELRSIGNMDWEGKKKFEDE